MNRREMLRSAPLLPFVFAGMGRLAGADELKSFVITKVTGFRQVGHRRWFVGKNSHLGNHGRTTSEHILRIMTDRGVEGIGVDQVSPAGAALADGRGLPFVVACNALAMHQEAGVPPWVRERLPLLYCGNELVWAPGLGVDVRYRGRGLVPQWRLL